jgi:hypothetical protein
VAFLKLSRYHQDSERVPEPIWVGVSAIATISENCWVGYQPEEQHAF